MQFSIISLVAALAATTSATYVPTYNTTTVAYYPTGTSAPTGTGTGPAPTASFTQTPFEGAAFANKQNVAGSALGLVIAGGVALML